MDLPDLEADAPRETDPDPVPVADAGEVELYEPFAPGSILAGRYRIERTLGRGASGVVYEASHIVVGRRVAIKCLFPHVAANEEQVARLFREAKIAATVDHANVVEVFDGGRDGETHFLVMEHLVGQTLAEYLERESVAIETVVGIFAQIMSGVAAVHDMGVVHRDLKPDNVFLARDASDPMGPGRAKVLDFGVSKLRTPGRELTQLGTVMGTPYYMAPEQVADTRSVDQRADVYSLGVMIYEAIGKAMPYLGDSVVEVYTQATGGRPTPLHELRPDVPPSLEALVARAMCPDKGARYSDVHEMRDALLAVRLDGSDRAQDWSNRLEPWMLDPSSGAARQGASAPLGTEATQAMGSGSQPRVSTQAARSGLHSMEDLPTRAVPAVTVAPRKPDRRFFFLIVAALVGGAIMIPGGVLLFFLLR